jgi:hypothetical protein
VSSRPHRNWWMSLKRQLPAEVTIEIPAIAFSW